jgi:hypothetical protein
LRAAFCADTPVLVAFGENSNILPVRSDDDVADVSAFFSAFNVAKRRILLPKKEPHPRIGKQSFQAS